MIGKLSSDCKDVGERVTLPVDFDMVAVSVRRGREYDELAPVTIETYADGHQRWYGSLEALKAYAKGLD